MSRNLVLTARLRVKNQWRKVVRRRWRLSQKGRNKIKALIKPIVENNHD